MYLGGTTNYTVYTATPGSAPVTSGASIPSTAQIVAFGADGTNAVFVASGSGMSFLYSLDSTSSSATPKQLASLSAAGGGGGANGFVATGGYIFTTLGPAGSQTEPITRYSIADGSSSVVGHYLSQGQTGKPIVVTASSVYVLENNPSGGGQIEKWARP